MVKIKLTEKEQSSEQLSMAIILSYSIYFIKGKEETRECV